MWGIKECNYRVVSRHWEYELSSSSGERERRVTVLIRNNDAHPLQIINAILDGLNQAEAAQTESEAANREELEND